MKLRADGFLGKYLRKTIEDGKRKHREKPVVPFVSEKKQMWYFLMNEIDKKQAGDGAEKGEAQK